MGAHRKSRLYRHRVASNENVVFIKQVRPSAVLAAQGRSILVSLGLGEVGKWTIQPDSASTFGVVKRIDDAIEVKRGLAEEFLNPRTETVEACVMSESVSFEEYEVPQGSGTKLVVGDRAAAWIERSPTTTSATWIAQDDVDVAGFLDVALGDDRSGEVEVYTTDEEVQVLSVSDGESLARLNGQVVVARAATKTATFYWQRPLSGEDGPRELGAVANGAGFDGEILRELVAATGSAVVQVALDQFVDRMNG